MPSIWIHTRGTGVLRELGIERVEDAWRIDLPGSVINDRGDRQVLKLQPPGVGQPVYLKRWRFSESSPFRFLPGRFALRNRATSEKRNLETLLKGGIVAPQPLALGETPGPFGPIASFLLLENLTGYSACADRLPMPIDRACEMISGITATLARLHDMGLFARSPGLKHFYVTEDLSSFGLIDVPRLDRSPSVISKWTKQTLGGDPPSRERDLSKVLVEWETHFPDREKWLAAFWSGYATRDEELAADTKWQNQVLNLGETRRKVRSRKG